MQRLARTQVDQINQSAVELFQHYDALTQIIRRYLPPSTANLLARPRVIQGEKPIVEWYSNLEGQPTLLTNGSIQKAQIEQANTLIEQRLNAITGLKNDLVQKNAISPEQTKLLSLFIEGASHNTRQVYLVNNEPVITGWGMGKPPEPPKQIQPVLSSPVVPVRKHSWCCWLLPLLLLLLLLATLLWWLYFKPKTSIAFDPMPPVVAQEIAKPVVELATKPEPQPEPKPEPIAESQSEPEPESQPVPVAEDISSESVPEAQVEPPKPEKTCVADMKPEERPQMVIVFDDSPSMTWSLAESPRSIQQFIDRAQFMSEGEVRAGVAHMSRQPQRITVAKTSSEKIIDSIEKGIDIGLVVLKTCPAANNYGFFSTNKRTALKNQIRAMHPLEEAGTPLYSGLKKAAAMVDGVKRDAFILLISDGEDTCKTGNVCALAAKLAKQKPRLKINVVDIGGARAANCVAKATHGKVFTANNQAQLIDMINQASKPVAQSQGCE